MFNKVNPKQSFPKLEEEILKFWKKEKIFEASIENRSKAEDFFFFDGPPFATGTPHYGHILAGTIKDVVPRYQTMKGKRVERKFGWDTHGLPIENIVEKKLEISGKEQIEEVGIFKFNEICRENVLTYVNEWRKVVERMGRWIDMDNDYKTMDTSFMESVWWVFKSIYDKGLIYEGNRVVPYCPRCSTPLANFEVNQGYKDKQDKSITVKFKMLPDSIKWEDKEKQNLNKFFLAWTTTPWTLMSNLGLAVGEDVEYSEIKDLKTGEIYILATDRLDDYYKSDEEYELLATYKGTRLEGMKYEPIFDDFYKQLVEEKKDLGLNVKFGENTYSVVLGHHVDTSTGTGIVHIAPAYGEDDFVIGKKFDLGFVQHIDGTGKVVNTLKDNSKYVFDYNEEVISELKGRGIIVKIATIDHSYPHCRRCGTPLIYRGISAWYVAVEQFRDQMVVNNESINWVPESIKYGRFGNWLKNAIDWNISRNRYWGSAIPVWQSDDKKEEVCVGSIEELYELNKDFGQIEKKGDKYFYTQYDKEVDLHKHYVDEVFIANKKNFKAKKVLGVHGWTSAGILKPSSKWVFINKNLEKDGIFFDVPNFDKSKETSYKKWKEVLDNYDVQSYDTIIGGSFGCPVILQYLNENNIKIKRLVLQAPSGLKGNEYLEKIINEFNYDIKNIKNYCEELIVISSKDDDVVSAGHEYSKFFAKEAGVNLIIVNGFGHDFASETGGNILAGLVKYGMPFVRVPEVLDCWFESGSMPYASKHYPFENKDTLKIPADFIAEGLDQTRGWFYTLLILGTALFGKAPFSNVIVNGIVLAEDGKKMSKSLQNYPDPDLIFNNYGADAMRFYLMNSPVVEAQDFRFAESGVDEVVKKVILPLWNTYYFFVTYANIDKFTPNNDKSQATNNLDKWLISELNELIKEVTEGFDDYKLDIAAKPIIKFMDNLTNWYIRRSRKRFWKSENDSDKSQAYETLYYILVELTKIIAPFMPFVSEYIFKELTGKKSVHLEDFPLYNPKLIDEKLNADTDKVQKIITLGLAWRANNKIRVRQPLNSITITEKLENYYEEIIKEELNVKEILVVSGDKLAKKICKPNGRNIGPKFGKDVKFIMEEAKAGNFIELENGNVKVGDFELEAEDFEIEYQSEDKNAKIESGFGMVIAMDDTITEALKLEGYARDIVRHIQEARKEAGFEVDDRIEVEIKGVDEVLQGFKKYIETETLSKIVESLENAILNKDIGIEEMKVKIKLKK